MYRNGSLPESVSGTIKSHLNGFKKDKEIEKLVNNLKVLNNIEIFIYKQKIWLFWEKF